MTLNLTTLGDIKPHGSRYHMPHGSMRYHGWVPLSEYMGESSKRVSQVNVSKRVSQVDVSKRVSQVNVSKW